MEEAVDREVDIVRWVDPVKEVPISMETYKIYVDDARAYYFRSSKVKNATIIVG